MPLTVFGRSGAFRRLGCKSALSVLPHDSAVYGPLRTRFRGKSALWFNRVGAPEYRDTQMSTHQQLLTFEATHPRHTWVKDEAIRRELGITPARYYVLLGRAAESVEGIAHDPVTARRVRERRNHAA